MIERMIQIRDASERDIDRLAALGAQVQTLHAEGRSDLFRPADSEALRGFFRHRLSQGSMILVAGVDGEEPEGYVLAEVLDRPQSPFQFAHIAVEVHHIAVDETFRRQGVGELLISAVIERAQQVGAAFIRLDSWSFNTEAHSFFEAQGFVAARFVFERSQA